MIDTSIHNVKSLEVWTNAKHKPDDGDEPYTTTRIWVKTHDEITFGVTLFSDGPIEFIREDYGPTAQANALPAVEAQLNEAVELLRTVHAYLLANVPKGGVRKAFHELNAHACQSKAIHAFLAKVEEN